MKPVVFLPERISDAGMDVLRGQCELVIPWEDGVARNHDEVRALLYEADGVIVRLFEIRAGDLEKTNRLKVIAKHGVGVDNIDTGAATAKGIPVVHTPIAPALPVVEFTIGVMLALGRKICPADRAVRAGRYSERLAFAGVEFRGRTLGIAGLGEIGRGVARAASAGLGMKVIAYDPFVSKENYDGPARLVDSLDALLAQADVVTLHVPLTSATRHLIDRDRLAALKPGCLLINASRGPVVDEKAIVAALESGLLAGAALDVFEQEPLPGDHPLCRLPNVILTPHIASATPEAMDRMAIGAAQGVLDALQGRRPEHVYNRRELG